VASPLAWMNADLLTTYCPIGASLACTSKVSVPLETGRASAGTKGRVAVLSSAGSVEAAAKKALYKNPTANWLRYSVEWRSSLHTSVVMSCRKADTAA